MSTVKDEMAKHEADLRRVEDIERKVDWLRLQLGDAIAVARNKAHAALARAAMAVQR